MKLPPTNQQNTVPVVAEGILDIYNEHGAPIGTILDERGDQEDVLHTPPLAGETIIRVNNEPEVSAATILGGHSVGECPPDQEDEGNDIAHAECSICMGHYENGETIIWLPCLHRFHKECYNLWFSGGHSTCPECRTRTGDISQLPTYVIGGGPVVVPLSVGAVDIIPPLPTHDIPPQDEDMSIIIEAIRRRRRLEEETEHIRRSESFAVKEQNIFRFLILPIHISILLLGIVTICMAFLGAVPGPLEPVTDIGLAEISGSSCFELTSHWKKRDYILSELQKMCKGLVMPTKNDAGCFTNSNRRWAKVNNELFCELSITKPGTLIVKEQSCGMVGIPDSSVTLHAITDSHHFEKNDYIEIIYNECREGENPWEMCFVPDDGSVCAFDSSAFCAAESTAVLVNGLGILSFGLILLISGILYPFRMRIIRCASNPDIRFEDLWVLSMRYITVIGILVMPLILFLVCWTMYEWHTFVDLTENHPRYGSGNNSNALLDPGSLCGIMHAYSQILLWSQLIMAAPVVLISCTSIGCIGLASFVIVK